MYNNTPSNAIVNAASNISYKPMIQADVFEVHFMNELKNLTNVVIGKLDKHVYKQNRCHEFFFFFINYSIIIVQDRYMKYISYTCTYVSDLRYSQFKLSQTLKNDGLFFNSKKNNRNIKNGIAF